MTRLHTTGDVDRFVTAAEVYLLGDPVIHTVALTVVAQLQAGTAVGDGPPRFGWLTDDDDLVIAAASWTPPYPVSLATDDPSYAEALADGFRDAGGVIGSNEAAHAFATAVGRPATLYISELQYRLDQVDPPDLPPGGPQPIVTDADLDLAAGWLDAFVAETGVMRLAGPTRDAVASRLARGVLWFWSDQGAPVCMAGYVNAAGGVPRVGPVYTPPEHRGHGYAAALTAAVAEYALARGAVAVTLFADEANPTSNHVYQRIGFREVARVVDLRFADPAAGSGSER
jgi:GNAT superfamily N-acetyltransferase